ncbi:MAG: hypothetical protein CM15mP58_21370 [Burkholderiaceae bacterium]|nr:MAG: hypothetical protein CM15mP58_21370 [Burkholderiaceae bacterium]
MKRPFNFGAGPAQLPEQVLRRLSVEAINWKGSGMAVAELPHRGKLFQEIIEETKLLTASLLACQIALRSCLCKVEREVKMP